ncbi:MAG: hypothetical protein UV70_C0019G0006 [Parcubacteria group bacterium GW2011_GWA2_43_13]|uniref:Type IV secretion system coupling protein TraD DNA-binding domain-containing protein n=1 Tax=Candidatus Magasanikbacteria bacterium RIFCSPLOWO2_02_FULL_44_11 TaxID=1798689 RepID=A0A1F6NA98_9BACT|nr:MAG: hypothetical protein UV70_C0019G0006 [Parcubacteria group bacterium GW2011_GWA2_43_13]OGH80842.1 MAG: hypothetical protein A3I29_02125 [Candidatus Magasanikbacteria bacterium RIFCSPLOWO2_02_FULL_44_11]
MEDQHEEEKPQQPEAPAYFSDPNINFFAKTNYRGSNRKFGIKIDDRRRHMYVVGKTGMGKTTLLENMVLNDIYAGHGVGLVDPHGDFAEKILNYIPTSRINDVVYFNPADINFPIGFNILETINPEHRHLVASGLMGVFKKIWPDVWSARMEYILNNTILALLDYPGTTLLGINRLLADKDYRDRVVKALKDPVVKTFWQTEFAGYSEKFRTEAVAPIQNKIGQFLSASVIRNIVAQVKSRINIREIMDNKKIFIMNLSKGRIGEDNSRLLGGMLITKIQLAAMERVDMPEAMRSDFFLYVDEFQNFATESFANILSEARKYRLDLTMAHQYMEQLDEKVLAAVIGNVGTTVTFRVGSSDAEILAKEFIPTFVEEDLINLPKFQIYLKLMIDGVASRPFSAETLEPIAVPTASTEKVIRVSRERYAVSREKIEDKIMRWSGMVPGAEEDEDGYIDSDGAETSKPTLKIAPAPESSAAPKKTSGPSPVVNLRSTTFGVPPKPPTGTGKFSGGGASRPAGGNASPAFQKKKPFKPNRPSMPTGEPQKVLLGDPKEKGISLDQAMKVKQPPAQKPVDPFYSSMDAPSIVKDTPAAAPKEIRPEPKVTPTLPKDTKSNPKPLEPGKVTKIDQDGAQS